MLHSLDSRNIIYTGNSFKLTTNTLTIHSYTKNCCPTSLVPRTKSSSRITRYQPMLPATVPSGELDKKQLTPDVPKPSCQPTAIETTMVWNFVTMEWNFKMRYFILLIKVTYIWGQYPQLSTSRLPTNQVDRSPSFLGPQANESWLVNLAEVGGAVELADIES